MKKLLSMLFLILCITYIGTFFDVSNTLYVSYMHFKYENEMIQATFLSPSSMNVGKNEGESESQSTILNISDYHLSGIFNKANASTVFDMNYKHTVAVIFDFSYLKKELLEEFNEYTINNKLFDFSFYLFVSSYDAKELFSFKNPENESSYYSLLNVNNQSMYLYKYSSPLHFLTYLTRYKADEPILFPIVNINKNFNIDGNESTNLEIAGISCYQSEKYVNLNKEEFEDAIYFNSFKKGAYYSKDDNLILKRNKVKIHIDDKIRVSITSYNDSLLNLDKHEVEKNIKKRLVKLKDFLYNIGFDYFNIYSINKTYKKNFSQNDIIIDFKIKCI